jgi:hypothetical protein
MEFYIAIAGAFASILIAIISSLLAHRNSLKIQIRNLKESHYFEYMSALHNLSANPNDEQSQINYAYSRNKMLLTASESVIQHLLALEKESAYTFDKNTLDPLITPFIKALRRDLKIKDKHYPKVSMLDNSFLEKSLATR